MTYPSAQADLENDIVIELPPERSSKSKGKQREIIPDNTTTPIRPLPRVPPIGLGIITAPGIGEAVWEGTEAAASGFVAPAGNTGGSLAAFTATTSSASSTASSSSIYNSGSGSSRSTATSSSSHNITTPLRSALANPKSHSSLANSSRYASPSSTTSAKFQSPSRTTNSPAYGSSLSSSPASVNPPSASSSSKSPIPSSWASRPMDLNPQIPSQRNNANRGYTLPTPSSSRPPSQLPTPPLQQPSRTRVDSVTGVRPPLTTSVPVVTYGNRNRSGSGSMGASSSGSFGSRTIMGARTRSQSRTRTGTNVSILPTGNGSSTSRRSSRDRDRSVDASSQKSTSMPSSPVMKSMHMAFSSSPGAISSSSVMPGTSTTPYTPSRPPRTLPSPVIPSGSLNSFSPSSSSVSVARSLPRAQPISSTPLQASVLSSSIANTTGKRALPPSPASIPVGRPLGRREPSIPRGSQNSTPRKLPQPSLAAHIASISAVSSHVSAPDSTMPPFATTSISSPSINSQPNFRAQSAAIYTTHQPNLPKDILTATTPLSHTYYNVASPSIRPESEVHIQPMTSDVMEMLASQNRLDDDRSSLSSFKARRGRGQRDSHSDLEVPSDLDDLLRGGQDVLTRVDVKSHIRDHDPDHLDVFPDEQNYRALSRSPSPMRYARPESMGMFTSSEDEELGIGRRGRGRRGREGGPRPTMTRVVARSDRGPGNRSDSSDAESGSAAGGSEGRGKRSDRKTQLRAFRNSYKSSPFLNKAGMDLNKSRNGSGHVAGSIGSNDLEEGAESSKGSDRWWKKLKVKDKEKVHRAKD